jgi:hypothetical protein
MLNGNQMFLYVAEKMNFMFSMPLLLKLQHCKRGSRVEMLLRNLDEGNNDKTKFQENVLGTSTCPRYQQGAFNLARMQLGKQG